MAIWFLDTQNGDDANDGKASVAVAFAVKTLNYVFGVYNIVDEAVAAQVEDDDVIYITSATVPAQAAWWTVVDVLGAIVTCELFSGTWVETTRTDCVSASGPFRSLAKLKSALSSSDRAYSVGTRGSLTQIYPAGASTMGIADEIIAAGLSMCLEVEGEDIVYTPSGGTGRSIRGLIEREEPAADLADLDEPLRQRIVVTVLDSATEGISPASITLGEDTITLPRRVGDLAEPCAITALMAQDGGRVQVELG